MKKIKAKTIEIEVGKIKPNPFKKFIDKGDLSEIVIEELLEGFEQTTFHHNLSARENKDGEVELIYGHHRLEAVKRFYGDDYVMTLRVYSYKDFSDEKMLIDMIRENLTQRGNDFQELLHSILLVKRWLEGTLFNEQAKPKEITNVDIANFISQSGRALASSQVARYLSIENGLDEEIKNKVEISARGADTSEGKVGLEMAFFLSKTKKEDQPYLLAQIKKAGVNKDKARHLITAYNNSDEELKESVKTGKVALEDVPIESMKQEIKKNLEERKNKSGIKVIPYKKYLDEASGMVGEANTEIYKACAMLHGLEQSGILYELDWKEVQTILALAKQRSEEYSKFIEKISERLGL
jgi:hypothetical protein